MTVFGASTPRSRLLCWRRYPGQNVAIDVSSRQRGGFPCRKLPCRNPWTNSGRAIRKSGKGLNSQVNNATRRDRWMKVPAAGEARSVDRSGTRRRNALGRAKRFAGRVHRGRIEPGGGTGDNDSGPARGHSCVHLDFRYDSPILSTLERWYGAALIGRRAGGYRVLCLRDALSPLACGSVSRMRRPCHLNRVISANGDAMLLTSTGFRIGQHGNSIHHDQRFRATSIHTQTAPGTFLFENNGHPFVTHRR